MVLLNLQEENKVLHPLLLGPISSYSWRCLFTLVTCMSIKEFDFRFQSKFPLVKFCSKGRTAFYFIAMVGDDALHFGGLHNSAKFICLQQNRDQVWHTVPHGGSGILAKQLCFLEWDKQANWLTLKIWLHDWVSNSDKQPIDVRFELIKKSGKGWRGVGPQQTMISVHDEMPSWSTW